MNKRICEALEELHSNIQKLLSTKEKDVERLTLENNGLRSQIGEEEDKNNHLKESFFNLGSDLKSIIDSLKSHIRLTK